MTIDNVAISKKDLPCRHQPHRTPAGGARLPLLQPSLPVRAGAAEGRRGLRQAEPLRGGPHVEESASALGVFGRQNACPPLTL